MSPSSLTTCIIIIILNCCIPSTFTAFSVKKADEVFKEQDEEVEKTFFATMSKPEDLFGGLRDQFYRELGSSYFNVCNSVVILGNHNYNRLL